MTECKQQRSSTQQVQSVLLSSSAGLTMHMLLWLGAHLVVCEGLRGCSGDVQGGALLEVNCT